MPRSMWGGSVSFGLVNVPVKLFAATSPKGVHFHMLRSTDNSRIQYKKVSAADGSEVPEDKIVKGYELEPEHYVTLTAAELDALDSEKNCQISILKFVDMKEIDCILFDKAYFLTPDENAAKAYALLLAAMKETKKVAIARMVLHSREHLVVLRPYKNAVSLFTLYYDDELVQTESLDSLPAEKDAPKAPELAVARQLVEAISGPFKPDEFKDEYRERVMELVKQKAAGKKIVAAPGAPARPTNVVDLMSALKASLKVSKGGAKNKEPKEKAKPRRAERKRAKKSA
jgi:DNA end-binding protein Ku